MSQPVTFVDRAGRLLGTPEAAAVDRATRHMTAARDAAIEELSWSGDLRDRVRRIRLHSLANLDRLIARFADRLEEAGGSRSEEHTSELQSRPHLVCRLLL